MKTIFCFIILAPDTYLPSFMPISDLFIFLDLQYPDFKPPASPTPSQPQSFSCMKRIIQQAKSIVQNISSMSQELYNTTIYNPARTSSTYVQLRLKIRSIAQVVYFIVCYDHPSICATQQTFFFFVIDGCGGSCLVNIVLIVVVL